MSNKIVFPVVAENNIHCKFLKKKLKCFAPQQNVDLDIIHKNQNIKKLLKCSRAPSM